jgi:hypothetical protein
VPHCADKQAGYYVGLPVGDAQLFKKTEPRHLDMRQKKRRNGNADGLFFENRGASTGGLDRTKKKPTDESVGLSAVRQILLL